MSLLRLSTSLVGEHAAAFVGSTSCLLRKAALSGWYIRGENNQDSEKHVAGPETTRTTRSPAEADVSKPVDVHPDIGSKVQFGPGN